MATTSSWSIFIVFLTILAGVTSKPLFEEPSPRACPTIISRAAWGARAPSGTPSRLATPVSHVVIHHGASGACTTQTACAAMVRSYQNTHMNSNGWSDIGYNFIVGEDGNVYQGRGWDAVGAHATNWNSRSIGIAVIGDFTSRNPNAAAQNAVRNLISCGVSNGRISSTYRLVGHRQVGSTACPGNTFYNTITTWPRWGNP